MTPLDIAMASSGQAYYRVVTAKGVPLGAVPTTTDQRRAMASAKAAAAHYPGCYVEELEVSVRRRRVYRPRTTMASTEPQPASASRLSTSGE